MDVRPIEADKPQQIADNVYAVASNKLPKPPEPNFLRKIITVFIFLVIILLAVGGIIFLPDILNLNSIDNHFNPVNTRKHVWVLYSAINPQGEINIYQYNTDKKLNTLFTKSNTDREKLFPAGCYKDDKVAYLQMDEEAKSFDIIVVNPDGTEINLTQTEKSIHSAPKGPIAWDYAGQAIYFVDENNNLASISYNNESVFWKVYRFVYRSKPLAIRSFCLFEDKIALVEQIDEALSALWVCTFPLKAELEKNKKYIVKLQPNNKLITKKTLKYATFNLAGTRVAFLQSSVDNYEIIASVNLEGKDLTQHLRTKNFEISPPLYWNSEKNTWFFIAADKREQKRTKKLYRYADAEINAKPEILFKTDAEITSFTLMKR